MDDEAKAVVLLCSLPSSYDHMVTTLTHVKEKFMLDSISSTLMDHAQRNQGVEEGGGGSVECPFVKRGAECGRGKK